MSSSGESDNQPFWRRKSLENMTRDEWEALCDGCGRCCMLKLEDEDTGDIHMTRVACKLLNIGTCRCTDYADRHSKVPDCLRLTPAMTRELSWLPDTCAYRLIDEGSELLWWHPLVSGDRDSVHAAGISIAGHVTCEQDVDETELEDHIIHWVDF